MEHLLEFKKTALPLIKRGIKLKPNFLEKFAEVLGIVNEFRFCQEMKWTFTQLEEEIAADPFRVAVAMVMYGIDIDVKKYRQEEAEKLAKKTKKRPRRRRR